MRVLVAVMFLLMAGCKNYYEPSNEEKWDPDPNLIHSQELEVIHLPNGPVSRARPKFFEKRDSCTLSYYDLVDTIIVEEHNDEYFMGHNRNAVDVPLSWNELATHPNLTRQIESDDLPCQADTQITIHYQHNGFERNFYYARGSLVGINEPGSRKTVYCISAELLRPCAGKVSISADQP